MTTVTTGPVDPVTGARCSCEKSPFLYHADNCAVSKAYATRAVRLNVGCGDWPLPGFVNIDSAHSSRAAVVAAVPPIPYPDASVDEIAAIHFLEHLTFEDGAEFLRECYRVLRPGGLLCVVVPDTRLIMDQYVRGTNMVAEEPSSGGRLRQMKDLDDVCAMFLFSTVQESHHLWSYDLMTLSRAMGKAGFPLLREIDRMADPRLGTPAVYQCGLEGLKPGGSNA